MFSLAFSSIIFDMGKVFLSVIIPSYDEMANLQKGVLDKIEHFLSKKQFSYEVIIVDDGSTDGSVDFVKNFAPALHLIPEDIKLHFCFGQKLVPYFYKSRNNSFRVLLLKIFFSYSANHAFIKYSEEAIMDLTSSVVNLSPNISFAL